MPSANSFPTVNEHDLIEQAQQGDRLALGHVLLLYQPRLLRRLAARMPPSLSRIVCPEDILQQCYKRAFRDIATFEIRGDGSFCAWLQTIADHELLNTIKAFQTQKRGGHARRVTGYTSDDSVADFVHALAGDVDTPSCYLRQTEAVEALQVALAELPGKYREVICRRYLRGEQVAEIAASMHRTPASIRAMIHRAKQRLRETLEKLSLFLSSGR